MLLVPLNLHICPSSAHRVQTVSAAIAEAILPSMASPLIAKENTAHQNVGRITNFMKFPIFRKNFQKDR
jgi:hypothetical protein